MSNPLEDIDTAELAARAAVLADLAKYVGEQRDRHKAELASRMPAGSKITGRHPLDETLSLGTVTMSDPKPQAYVTDRDTYEAWCRATYPDQIDTWIEIDPQDAEVIAVLREHAPHLVIVHSSVPAAILEKGLERAAKEDVPGTKRAPGRPVLSVRATANARTVVRSMVAASPVLRELEA